MTTSRQVRGPSVIIHRWQPTGRTPCGLVIGKVPTNHGSVLSEGVTCQRCLRATTTVSWFPGGRNADPHRSPPKEAPDA